MRDRAIKKQKSDSNGIRNEIQYEHYLSSSVVITIIDTLVRDNVFYFFEN